MWKFKIVIISIFVLIPIECYSDAWDDKECVIVVAPAFIRTQTYKDPYLYVYDIDFDRSLQNVVWNKYGKGETITLDKWWYTVPQRLSWNGVLVFFFYNGEWIDANLSAGLLPQPLSHELLIGSVPFGGNYPADLPINCEAIPNQKKSFGPPDMCQ